MMHGTYNVKLKTLIIFHQLSMKYSVKKQQTFYRSSTAAHCFPKPSSIAKVTIIQGSQFYVLTFPEQIVRS